MKLQVDFKEQDNFNIHLQESEKLNACFQQSEEYLNTGFDALQPIAIMENDYNKLQNLPRINSITLQGNLSLSSLGLKGIYYDTTAAWNMMPDLIGEKGYLYIYSDYQQKEDEVGNITYIPGIRIGDGLAYLCDLPFLSGGITQDILDHINNTEIHITNNERTFWNNKVTSFLDQSDNENLILSKTSFITEGDIFNG